MAFANTPFYPIVPLRSDGLFEVTTRSGKKEINGPSGAQLDATPDANGVVDCYERLDHNGTKGIDWRRKLAAMLIHHIGEDAHKKKEWILEEFPEGYTLWEQQKWNEKTTTKAKNKHAPGFYDRQDAYLYGHPQGKKRRYRSPAEFFPHLLWLCCDKDGDPNNCPCRLCSPKGGNSTADRADSPDTKETLPPASNNVTNSSDGGKPIVIELEQNNTRTQTPTPKPTLKPGPQPPSAPPKAAVQSIIRSKEQVLDSQANGQYIYRPGELVWFNKGQAWGLSVIAKRQVQNDAPRYLVQPLSHPLNHPQAQIKEREDLLRPWLAWSVPATTNKAVATTPYDEVDWEPVRQQRYPGDPEVDGSILAAKVIDTSYSLFDRLDVPAPAGESHYNGMFLGAEKIWVGEPVRLKVPGDDIVVLIIQRLVERTTPPSNSTVTFIGDVYKFVTMPMPYKSREEWPKPDLPPRMVADLQFRNEVADSAHKGQWCEWRLLEPAARRGLSDIKGRWYETRALLPILKGQQTFLQEISQGIASDVSTSMNGRGDSSQATSQRKKNRKDTLGQAVPADFKVSRGLDGPPSDDVFPDIMEIDGDQFYNGVNQ